MSEFRRRLTRANSKKYAIVKWKNPKAMAIVYSKGWALNPYHMTFEEAAAVTTTQFNNGTSPWGYSSKISHFDEFEHFTGVTRTGEGNTKGNFNNSRYLKRVKLPPNLTTLGFATFFKCSALRTVYIPNSVTSVKMGRSNWNAGGLFEECTKLTSVRYSPSVDRITSRTFYKCTSLREITDIGNILYIGGEAFTNCKALTEFTIPATVTRIGCSVVHDGVGGSSYTDSVFSGCTGLVNITCLPTTPPLIQGTHNFDNTTCTISVPAESVEDYKVASGWSDVADRIVAIQN